MTNRHKNLKNLKRQTSLFALLFCVFCVAHAEEFLGQVVKIADGDTLTVLSDGAKIRVRLSDIQAPERGRPYSRFSTNSLTDMCLNQSARVAVKTIDKYQRTVGRVFCAGLDTSYEQIRRGAAKVYRRYPHDKALLAVEARAKAGQQGLWRASRKAR